MISELPCECALDKDDQTKGHCPLPPQPAFYDYIDAIKEIWNGDNCHTSDRKNMIAQIDCGVGDNDNRLSKATQLAFNMTYYP